jgi:hypothetical protein
MRRLEGETKLASIEGISPTHFRTGLLVVAVIDYCKVVVFPELLT